MADGDSWRQFLTGTTRLDGVSFLGATGARWTQLGTAIFGSLVAASTIGGVAIVQGIERAVTSVLAALAGGYKLLLREYVEVPIAAVRGLYSFGVDQYGILALPITVAVSLLTFWIVSQGINRIRGVLQ